MSLENKIRVRRGRGIYLMVGGSTSSVYKVSVTFIKGKGMTDR